MTAPHRLESIVVVQVEGASRTLTATRIAIAVGALWLLIGPRFDLISVGGSSIRVEDGIFVLFGVAAIVYRRRVRLRRNVVVALGALVLAAVVSACVAAGQHTIGLLPGLLYSVRPLEYAAVYPAAVLLLRGGSRRWQGMVSIGLAVCTVAECVTSLLQVYLQLPIGYGPPSFVRATGLTTGPYELGALTAALLIFWAARRSWLWVAAAAVPLWLSGSRISLIGALLGLVVILIDHLARRRQPRSGSRRFRRKHVVVALLVVVPLAALVPVLPTIYAKSIEPSISRLGQTSILAAWERAAEIADRQPTVRTSADYKRVALDNPFPLIGADQAVAEGLDLSNILRFFKWKLALDAMTTPQDVAFGLGPSFIGPAMDGNLLRFYVDGGVVGVIAWAVLIVAWFRKRPWWFRSVLIAYLAGALFIDVFVSLRSMVLLWLLLAISETLGAPLPGGRRSRRASHLDRADTQQLAAIDTQLLAVLRSSRAESRPPVPPAARTSGPVDDEEPVRRRTSRT